MKESKETIVIKLRVDKKVYSKICVVAEFEDRKKSAQINRILRDWAREKETKYIKP